MGLERILVSCISPWIVGRSAVVSTMHVPVPAVSSNALNLHKNARQPWNKEGHYSLEGTLFGE